MCPRPRGGSPLPPKPSHPGCKNSAPVPPLLLLPSSSNFPSEDEMREGVGGWWWGGTETKKTHPRKDSKGKEGIPQEGHTRGKKKTNFEPTEDRSGGSNVSKGSPMSSDDRGGRGGNRGKKKKTDKSQRKSPSPERVKLPPRLLPILNSPPRFPPTPHAHTRKREL